MKIILLTQEDPFYLPESIEDFVKKIGASKRHKILAAIISEASPFGKKKSFLSKTYKTFNVFGLSFFAYYSYKYIFRKLILRKSVTNVIKENKIPLWRLAGSINNKESVSKLKKINPDIIVIIAGNQIIRKQVLEIPKYGVINAHSSLLPKFKGLMPTFWVLKNKEKVTGVTVYKLTEGIDNGPIINSAKIKIDPLMTQSDLIKECKRVANDLIMGALDLINSPSCFKKNIGGSYYKFPTKIDVKDFYNKGKKFF